MSIWNHTRQVSIIKLISDEIKAGGAKIIHNQDCHESYERFTGVERCKEYVDVVYFDWSENE